MIHFRKRENNINKIDKRISKEEIKKEENNSTTNLNREIDIKNNQIIDPNFLVYNSKYLSKSKINNYNGLCEELKTLEIEYYIKNTIKNTNNLDIGEELEYEIELMKEKSEINENGYDFYNIKEIKKIIEIIKINPEKRKMIDLLKITKYLTTTKLGRYFKEEFFEQKQIFEKLITFCGVEMRYKFFKKGETIFKIGDLPDYFYMILFGKVDILKPFPKKTALTGYQYFCYLMDLKKTNEEYLFNLCIKENYNNFYIKKEEANDLNYIYLLNLLDKIGRNRKVDFVKALDITGITCDELDLDPNEITSHKYLLENIKQIRRKLPDISGAITHKYLFLDDRYIEKEIIIYDYFKFLTLETKSHFGDSAMDSNTTRNATVVASEDTHTAYINNILYYKNVVIEKAAVIDKKIHFLNSNFIFGNINPKKFEKKYFAWFICNTYKKGDILFHEGDRPNNVYFIEKGDVELYSSKNILEFQKVIDYLEKERNNLLKSKILEEKDEKNYIYTYDKINFDCSQLKEQINKKEKNSILLLKNNEDLGMLSFYFGYPYLVSCVVSSVFAKIYKIDNKYLSELLIKEKECYKDLVDRIEQKLSLFHERLFNINNMKLLMADHKKMIEQKEMINQKYNNNSTNNINNNAIDANLLIKNIFKEQQNNNNIRIKNSFNKTNIKINYSKLKEIFTKTSYVNKSLDSNNLNYNSKNNGQKVNYNLKDSLPFIKTQKSYKILEYNNLNDKKLSNNRTFIQDSEDLKNMKKNNSQKNIFLSQKNIKKILNKKSIEIKKQKIESNLLKSPFHSINNKSCILLNQTNYCIDPVLKKNYSLYENMNLNLKNQNNQNFKKLENNNSYKKNENEKAEDLSMKTQLIFNHHSLFNKLKTKQKSFYNYNNKSINYKSLSVNRNIEKYNKDEENYNNKSYIQGNNIVNIINIDDISENKKMKEINNYNHPYYAPLVLTKKEKYKIFTDDEIFDKKKKLSKRNKKELNNKKGLNEFGYPLEYNKKKINENMDYKNDYLRLKIKGIKFYKELVEKKNK